MAQKVVSRTQRRMERKQAMFLVLLVLVVSLASFSLGVMVGRSGQPESAATGRVEAPMQLPKPSPKPATADSQQPVGSVAGADGSGAAAEAKPEAEVPSDKLTFYDTLPRGDQPLGSGINLPPAVESPEPSVPAPKPVSIRPAVPAPDSSPQSARPRRSQPPAPAATASSQAAGRYVVQIASFRKPDQARALRSRLAGKGYVTFVQSADLGSKGIWHRVYAGPYTERALADKAAGRLRSEEKFSPLVRKR